MSLVRRGTRYTHNDIDDDIDDNIDGDSDDNIQSLVPSNNYTQRHSRNYRDYNYDSRYPHQRIRRNNRTRARTKTNPQEYKSDYFQALDELLATFELANEAPTSQLLMGGFGVYREVHKLSTSRNNTIPEHVLTAILRSTKNLVLGNFNHPSGYHKELDSYYKLSKEITKFPWGKVLAGAILSLIGTAIIVASGIIAFISFGILTPINILGVTFGISMITGGISTAIAATLGMGSVMGSGMLFFKAAEKNPLLREMELTARAAKEKYGFNT